MLGEQLEALVREQTSSGSTICAYVPVKTEPGAIEMLDMLVRRSARVLLPVARTGAEDVPLPLRWGEYRPGALTRGRWGVLEPAEAGLVLVPALAVDRTGVRLGRGRGFYDRSLSNRDPRAWLIAMVRDEELADELPADPHDVPMTHALMPRRGVIALSPTSHGRG